MSVPQHVGTYDHLGSLKAWFRVQASVFRMRSFRFRIQGFGFGLDGDRFMSRDLVVPRAGGGAVSSDCKFPRTRPSSPLDMGRVTPSRAETLAVQQPLLIGVPHALVTEF